MSDDHENISPILITENQKISGYNVDSPEYNSKGSIEIEGNLNRIQKLQKKLNLQICTKNVENSNNKNQQSYKQNELDVTMKNQQNILTVPSIRPQTKSMPKEQQQYSSPTRDRYYNIQCIKSENQLNKKNQASYTIYEQPEENSYNSSLRSFENKIMLANQDISQNNPQHHIKNIIQEEGQKLRNSCEEIRAKKSSSLSSNKSNKNFIFKLHQTCYSKTSFKNDMDFSGGQSSQNRTLANKSKAMGQSLSQSMNKSDTSPSSIISQMEHYSSTPKTTQTTQTSKNSQHFSKGIQQSQKNQNQQQDNIEDKKKNKALKRRSSVTFEYYPKENNYNSCSTSRRKIKDVQQQNNNIKQTINEIEQESLETKYQEEHNCMESYLEISFINQVRFSNYNQHKEFQ